MLVHGLFFLFPRGIGCLPVMLKVGNCKSFSFLLRQAAVEENLIPNTLPKVILNWLPPADIYMPSPAMSVLKEFLMRNEIPTKVLYWNLELDALFQKFYDINFFPDLSFFDSAKLLPFISLANEIKQSAENEEKIISLVRRYMARQRLEYPNEYYEIFLRLKDQIIKAFTTYLDNLNLTDVKLFGFHYNAYQWIPAITLAKIVKAKFPRIKIVIGGIGSKESGMSLL